jgi:hypothetical protein
MFTYRAYAWANAKVFDGRMPVPLLQWAFTEWGRCLGYTATRTENPPVITLHPGIWRAGWGAAGGGEAGREPSRQANGTHSMSFSMN